MLYYLLQMIRNEDDSALVAFYLVSEHVMISIWKIGFTPLRINVPLSNERESWLQMQS